MSDQDCAITHKFAESPGRFDDPSNRQDIRNIYLIGYRATGKSTVARLLAQQLGRPMVDTDELVETRTGLSIRKIFEQEGEPGFRRRESEILQEVAQRQGHIVATGGGIVLSSSNRRLLHDSGSTVWLIAPIASIWQRLQSDDTTWNRRPDLTIGGTAEIEELLNAREPFYRECADCTVETTNRLPTEVAAVVRACLNLG
jgi:shikimate kinase